MRKRARHEKTVYVPCFIAVAWRRPSSFPVPTALKGFLASRHDDSRVPSRRSPMSWHLDRLCVDAAADEDPRNERVGVPHLARAEFIAAPHDRRDVWNQSEQAPSDVRVFRNARRALDRFFDVRNDAVTPATDLIAEEPKSASRSAAYRALGDDAARFAVLPDRSLLDHETAFGQVDD